MVIKMKFVSFNINGLRAHLHQLSAIIIQQQPDIIGLQETKVHDELFPLKEVSQHGYHVFYYGQKGHYGVALLTRQWPLAIRRGLPTDANDAQRRIIMIDLQTPRGILTIINGYFPHGENRNHPTKFLAKKKFFDDLQNYLEQYFSYNSQILIMGDLNISPTEQDIGIGEENRKRWLRSGKCAFLPEERNWLARLQNWGLIDTFRIKHPRYNNKFSWFDYRSRGFDKNCGLRIDLLLASHSLAKYCIATDIDYHIRGMEKPSDHAPVWSEFIF